MRACERASSISWRNNPRRNGEQKDSQDVRACVYAFVRSAVSGHTHANHLAIDDEEKEAFAAERRGQSCSLLYFSLLPYSSYLQTPRSIPLAQKNRSYLLLGSLSLGEREVAAHHLRQQRQTAAAAPNLILFTIPRSCWPVVSKCCLSISLLSLCNKLLL